MALGDWLVSEGEAAFTVSAHISHLGSLRGPHPSSESVEIPGPIRSVVEPAAAGERSWLLCWPRFRRNCVAIVQLPGPCP